MMVADPISHLNIPLDLGLLAATEDFCLVPTTAALRNPLGQIPGMFGPWGLISSGARCCLQYHLFNTFEQFWLEQYYFQLYHCFSVAVWVPGSLSSCWHTNTSKEALPNFEHSLSIQASLYDHWIRTAFPTYCGFLADFCFVMFSIFF